MVPSGRWSCREVRPGRHDSSDGLQRWALTSALRRCVTTGQLGDQFHRITGVPGTTPHRLPPTDRRRGRGSPQATSAASSPSTETRTVRPRIARVVPASPVEGGTRVRWRRWFRDPRAPVATPVRPGGSRSPSRRTNIHASAGAMLPERQQSGAVATATTSHALGLTLARPRPSLVSAFARPSIYDGIMLPLTEGRERRAGSR